MNGISYNPHPTINGIKELNGAWVIQIKLFYFSVFQILPSHTHSLQLENLSLSDAEKKQADEEPNNWDECKADEGTKKHSQQNHSAE